MTDEFIVYKPKKSTLAEGRITFRGCDGKHGAVGNSFAVWGDSPRFWGILATGVATEATNAARTKPKVGRNQHRLRVESLLSLLIWLVIFYMRQSKVTIRFFVGDFHPIQIFRIFTDIKSVFVRIPFHKSINPIPPIFYTPGTPR